MSSITGIKALSSFNSELLFCMRMSELFVLFFPVLFEEKLAFVLNEDKHGCCVELNESIEEADDEDDEDDDDEVVKEFLISLLIIS